MATFSTKPIPVVPAKNSAATNVPQHIPTATLIPVKISGKEFGKITCRNICLFDGLYAGQKLVPVNTAGCYIQGEISLNKE